MSDRLPVRGNISYQKGNKSTLTENCDSHLVFQQQNRGLNYWSIRKTVDTQLLLLYNAGIFSRCRYVTVSTVETVKADLFPHIEAALAPDESIHSTRL